MVKDLPYELVDTHTRINNVAYYKAKIEYRFGDGTTRTLCSESMPIHDFDNRDKIDLLYDQQNNNNYYIDFNISK